MSMRGKLPLLLLLLAFLFATTLAFSTYDPLTETDPEEQLRRCVVRCKTESRPGLQQWKCINRCDKEAHQGRDDRREGSEEQQQQEEEEGSQGRSPGHPYVFEDKHFSTLLETEHGRVQLLQKFTQRSKLFKGIVNFRIGTLEADPQTFILPNHLDADAIFFVANGWGRISLIRKERRESFNLRRGDLVWVPAGTTIYLINRDNNEKLVIVKLLQPVSTPGELESFFGAGGQEPESYYRALSIDLVASALNTGKDKLQRLLKQPNEGVIVKASEEQIRSLTQKEEGGIWPFGGGESKYIFNLLDQDPTHQNEYGKIHDVDRNLWKALQEFDVAGVNYVNISPGSMEGPFYNSKATQIVVAIKGKGYFEMACPHVASSESGSKQGRQGGSSGGQTKSSPSYRKVSSQLRQGTVFIVPAGHPVIIVASQNQNLEVLRFSVGAQNNDVIPLAGKRNIFSQMEEAAEELTFNLKASVVNEVFQNQDDEHFFKAPQRQQEAEEGRAYA